MKHQLRSKGAPTLVLLHLEVLGKKFQIKTFLEKWYHQFDLGRIVLGCIGCEVVICDVVFVGNQKTRYQIKGGGNVRDSHSHLQV